MATRHPLALSLSGFQFTYRSSYFDWRLLHGIDVDTVIRLTDVQAVEDCLDTLQRGSFSAERDRLSPANCVQLFRLLQLAIEYCAHLRAAHALLLDCYNAATAAAESWKAAARTYLDVGAAFVSESLAAGGLSRGGLDATDGAKAALEGADRDYNTALDALEAEDSRARHFRFRKQRTEISWSQLHAADADRLVASLDVGLLEALLPNLTFGSITAEDDQQLTPHHFGQLIPLAQAALDYVLWQANATGALLEQAMAALQSACADIPTLTSATQELHAHITSLLLGGQPPPPGAGLLTGAATPTMTGGGGGVGGGAVGGGSSPLGVGPGLGASADMGYGGVGGVGAPLPWASADMYGSGRLGASPGFTRASSPRHPRPGSGGPGGSPQVLRIGPSRLGHHSPGPAVGGSYSGGLAALMGMGAGAGVGVPVSGSGTLDELVVAAAMAAATGGGGGGDGAAALPVLELHSRTAELTYKVDAIEQDLRMERSKTEEMRRILADIRDRLNQRPGGGGGVSGRGSAGGAATPPGGPGGGDASALGLSPAESLTFPAAASATLEGGMGAGLLTNYSAFVNTYSAAAAAGGGSAGGLRYGSAAGVNISGPQFSDPTPGPSKVRVFVDEDAIREQERQRAVQVLARQAERLKQQMLREHQERRLATSVASSVARASLQLQQPGGAAAGGSGVKEGGRHSRQGSRDARRSGGAARRSSPGKMSLPASGSNVAIRGERDRGIMQGGQMADYGSDPELAAATAMMLAGGAAGSGSGSGSFTASRQGSGGGAAAAAGGAAASRPPRPLSRLSGPTMHGSLGDLPAAAGAPGMFGMAGGGGGGGGSMSRMAMTAGSPGLGGGGPAAARGYGGSGHRGGPAMLTDSAEDAMALPPPSMLASVDSPAVVVGSRAGGGGAGGSGGVRGSAAIPQAARLAAAAAFGSISLVGPEKEAAAQAAAAAAAAAGSSGHPSKASSFSDRLSYRSVPDAAQGGGGDRTGGTSSGGGGWDAAQAVAAGMAGR